MNFHSLNFGYVMKIVETPIFRYYLKKIKDKNIQKNLEKAKKLLLENQSHPSLQFKKINCKKEKSRYSIRINKEYRVLLNIKDEKYFFHCICNHDEYDRINKNC